MKALIRRTQRKSAIADHPFVNKFAKYHVPLKTRQGEIVCNVAYKDIYISYMIDHKAKPTHPSWTTVNTNSEIYETPDVLNKIYKNVTLEKD